MILVAGVALMVQRAELLAVLLVLIPVQIDPGGAAKPPCWKPSSATPIANTANAPGSDVFLLLDGKSDRVGTGALASLP